MEPSSGYSGNRMTVGKISYGGVDPDPKTPINTSQELEEFLTKNNARLFFEQASNTYVIEIRQDNFGMLITGTEFIKRKRVDVRLITNGTQTEASSDGNYLNLKTPKFYVAISVHLIEELLTNNRFTSSPTSSQTTRFPRMDETSCSQLLILIMS